MTGWRRAMIACSAVALVCVAIALFTTFDSVQAGGTDCGCPANSPSEPSPACAEELGHARATRTAALAWGMVALAAAWACDTRSRRSRSVDARAPGEPTG